MSSVFDNLYQFQYLSVPVATVRKERKTDSQHYAHFLLSLYLFLHCIRSGFRPHRYIYCLLSRSPSRPTFLHAHVWLGSFTHDPIKLFLISISTHLTFTPPAFNDPLMASFHALHVPLMPRSVQITSFMFCWCIFQLTSKLDAVNI